MTRNLNHCHCVGTVSGDCEVRELSNGRTSASVRLEIVEHVKTQKGDIEIVEVVRIIAYNNLGKHLEKYATKGSTISAHGRLHLTAHGCEIRLTEPIGLEVRKCLTCGEEFLARDRGQRFCTPAHNPSAPDNLKPKLTEKGELKPLTPAYPE